jgi:hypothetical protein
MGDEPPPYDMSQDPVFTALIFRQDDFPRRNDRDRSLHRPENACALVIFLLAFAAFATWFYYLYTDPRRPR